MLDVREVDKASTLPPPGASPLAQSPTKAAIDATASLLSPSSPVLPALPSSPPSMPAQPLTPLPALTITQTSPSPPPVERFAETLADLRPSPIPTSSADDKFPFITRQKSVEAVTGNGGDAIDDLGADSVFENLLLRLSSSDAHLRKLSFEGRSYSASDRSEGSSNQNLDLAEDRQKTAVEVEENKSASEAAEGTTEEVKAHFSIVAFWRACRSERENSSPR